MRISEMTFGDGENIDAFELSPFLVVLPLVVVMVRPLDLVVLQQVLQVQL